MTGGQFISGVKIFRDNVTTAPQTVSVSQTQLQLPSIRNKTRIIRLYVIARGQSAMPQRARTHRQTDNRQTYCIQRLNWHSSQLLLLLLVVVVQLQSII